MASKAAAAAALAAADSNSSPYGGLSPLVQQMENWVVGQGPPLPRTQQSFTSGAFGPMLPIMPMAIDSPVTEGGRARPRRYQYMVGFNLPNGMPGTEGEKLVTFQVLQAASNMSSIARTCIDICKSDILSCKWNIVPTDSAALAMEGDPRARAEFEERKITAVNFWQNPDPRRFRSMSQWLNAILEDMLVLDAIGVYLHPAIKAGTGPFRSDFASLDAISGDTIKPLLNTFGEPPEPPESAYQCFSEDTEILTRRGWLTHDQLQPGDEFLTRKLNDGRLEYQQATAFHGGPYKGEMYHFNGRSLDLLVTPNHRILVDHKPHALGGTNNRWHDEGETFIRADELASIYDQPERTAASKAHSSSCSQARFPTTGYWEAHDLESFEIPWSDVEPLNFHVGVDGARIKELRIAAGLTQEQLGEKIGVSKGHIGRWEKGIIGTHLLVAMRASTILGEDIYDISTITWRGKPACGIGTISGDDLAAFMGMYLAEGCVTTSRGKFTGAIQIAQKETSPGYEAYHELLVRLVGDRLGYAGRHFGFQDWALANWLKPLGKSWEKYVPDEILNMSERQLEIFWHYYWLGDGKKRDGRQYIVTTSKRLADQLQEIALKLGFTASVSIHYRYQTPRGEQIAYMVTRRTTKLQSWNVETVDYDGHVWCVSVPNNTVCVRRNGRPSFTGNSYQWGIPRVDLMDALFTRQRDPSDDFIDEGLLEEVSNYNQSELIYLRRNDRNGTIYGFGEVEQAIVPISISLMRQDWQWNWFSNGSLPAVFLDPGASVATAEEARQLQDGINMLGGDLAMRHQVIVLPPGAKTMPQKDVDATDQFDEWITASIAMVFGLTLPDLGITPKAAMPMSSSSAAASNAQTEAKAQQRGILPRIQFLKNTLFDPIIQNLWGQRDMQWSWGMTESGQNQTEKITLWLSMLKASVATVDEVRVVAELDPIGNPETTVPLAFTATSVTPLGAAVQMGQAAADAIQSGTALPPGTAPKALPPGPQPPQPPSGSGGKPKPSAPKIDPDTADSPARHAAEVSDDTNTTDNPMAGGTNAKTSKSLANELEVLERYLRRGNDLSHFVPKHLSPKALTAAKAFAGDRQAVVGAVKRAQHHQDKRDAKLQALRTQVATGLGTLVGRVRQGVIGGPVFVDQGSTIISAAMNQATQMGADDAIDEYGTDDDTAPDMGDAATKRSAGVAGFLAGVLGAIVGAGSHHTASDGSAASDTDNSDDLDSRMNLYGEALTGGYEEGYGTGASSVMGEPIGTWVSEDDDASCVLCSERNGKTFTLDTLPGWPGDGGYGPDAEVCEGSVACRCSVEWRDENADATSDPQATTENIGRANQVATNMGVIADARAADAQATQSRQAAIDQLASGSEAQQYAAQRMANRDSVMGVPGTVQRMKWDEANTSVDPETGQTVATIVTGEPGQVPYQAIRDTSEGDYSWAPTNVDVSPPAFVGKAVTRSPKGITKAVGGYDIGPTSAMVSLDIPPGVISTVPGGVNDHHITVVFLGQDVSDEMFKSICAEVAQLAATTPGPLTGTLSQSGSFPAAADDDGRIPIFVVPDIAGINKLRKSLEHLNASSFADFKPHVTIGYFGQDDTPPPPLLPVPVNFTHLSVHRGSNTRSFAFAGCSQGANKSAMAEPGPCEVGAIMAMSRASGKVLLQQRASGDFEDLWEFPGGHLNEGETPIEAAKREWQEEVGSLLPDGEVVSAVTQGAWTGFLYLIEHEGLVEPCSMPQEGDIPKQVGWFHPKGLPPLRPEFNGFPWSKIEAYYSTQTQPPLNVAVKGITDDDIAKIAERVNKGGKLTPDERVMAMHYSAGWRPGAVLTSKKGGNAQGLIDWYNAGADGQISWGDEGDWQNCVDVASNYMSEDDAAGFCQLRHMDATGMTTSEHAAEE